MKFERKDILEIDFITNRDYDLFFDTINAEISSITNIKKSFLKKLIICSIELIQNNIIYNNKAVSRLELYSIADFFILDYIQTTNKLKFQNLANKIDNINKMDFDNIDLKIKENIEKPKFKSGSGNGLLTCRLKTKNQLYLELLDAKNENKYKFILRLKLDYYEKSNPSTSKNTFS